MADPVDRIQRQPGIAVDLLGGVRLDTKYLRWIFGTNMALIDAVVAARSITRPALYRMMAGILKFSPLVLMAAWIRWRMLLARRTSVRDAVSRGSTGRETVRRDLQTLKRKRMTHVGLGRGRFGHMKTRKTVGATIT